MTVDDLLKEVSRDLNLSSEAEWELLQEMRDHLEDAVADAQAEGYDPDLALLKAAERFGIDETLPALQRLHREWEFGEVLLMCSVPVFFTLVLRWLVYDAAGTAGGWQMIVSRPWLPAIALLLLIIPLWQLVRWRMAALVWAFFWLVSVIFMLYPQMRTW